jgi:hypothetical protein
MRVVVFVQENYTTDNYFRGLAHLWGAGRLPLADLAEPAPHDRHAYFRWLTTGKATHVQFDTAAVLLFKLHLATGAFFENHCSQFGTNSTPNYLVLVGGQSPTLRNPPRGTSPNWDMPSIFGLAEGHGVAWRAYTALGRGYPTRFYTQLRGSPHVVATRQFLADATSGALPPVYVWHAAGDDEHLPANVRRGMNLVWQSVDAVVRAGGRQETVFILI